MSERLGFAASLHLLHTERTMTMTMTMMEMEMEMEIGNNGKNHDNDDKRTKVMMTKI